MVTDTQRTLPHVRTYLWIAVAIGLVVSIIYLALPATRSFLVDEDRLLETTSALLDLSVFVYGLVLVIRRTRARGVGHSARRTGLGWPIFLALVGLWSCLEDMSYGQRLLGYPSPVVFGVPIDGLHDFAYVGKRYLDILIKYQARKLLVLVAILAAVAIGLAVRYRHEILRLAWQLLRIAPYFLFAIYVLLMAPSAILDLDVFSSPITTLVEEVFEFSASLALLFSCIAADSLGRAKEAPGAGPALRRAGG